MSNYFLKDVLVPELEGVYNDAVQTHFDLKNKVLDLTSVSATLRFKLFENGSHIYPYSVMLDSVTPLLHDADGNPLANAYTRVTPETPNVCVYRVNVEGNPTAVETNVLVSFNCVIKDLGLHNRALKFTFVDQRGVKFSYVLDGLAMWFTYSTKPSYTGVYDVLDLEGSFGYASTEDYIYPVMEDAYAITADLANSYEGVTYAELEGSNRSVIRGVPDVEGAFDPFHPNYNPDDIPDLNETGYFVLKSTGIGAYYDTSPIAIWNELATDVADPLKKNIGVIAKPFRLFDDRVSGRDGQRRIEDIPPWLLPTTVAIGSSQNLAATPFYFSDIGLFSKTLENGNYSYDLVYGRDSCVYVAVGVDNTKPYNTASNIYTATMGLKYDDVTYSGSYIAGATTDRLEVGELKAWRVNVPFDAALVSVLGNVGAIQFDKAWTDYVLTSATGVKTGFPTISFTVHDNPNEFEWVMQSPDGLYVPKTAYTFGTVAASSTRANVVTKSIRLRVTNDNDYVITGVEITNTTVQPVQLTALSKTAIAGDFEISGDISSVTTTGTLVSYAPTVFNRSGLEEVVLNVSYKPSLKIINVASMASPATLTPAILGAVNTRKLVLQVKGYKVGGDPTPVPLGSAFTVTGVV